MQYEILVSQLGHGEDVVGDGQPFDDEFEVFRTLWIEIEMFDRFEGCGHGILLSTQTLLEILRLAGSYLLGDHGICAVSQTYQQFFVAIYPLPKKEKFSRSPTFSQIGQLTIRDDIACLACLWVL